MNNKMIAIAMMILSVLNCTETKNVLNNNGNEITNLYLLAPLVISTNTYNNNYNGSDTISPASSIPAYDYDRFYIPRISASSYSNGVNYCKQAGASFDIIKISDIKYLMQLINLKTKTAGQQLLANDYSNRMYYSKEIFVSDTDGLYDPSQVSVYDTVRKTFRIGTNGNVFGVDVWASVICSNIK